MSEDLVKADAGTKWINQSWIWMREQSHGS